MNELQDQFPGTAGQGIGRLHATQDRRTGPRIRRMQEAPIGSTVLALAWPNMLMTVVPKTSRNPSPQPMPG